VIIVTIFRLVKKEAGMKAEEYKGGVKSGSGKIWHNNVLIIIVRTGQW
jgi:hypothetical protein